LLADPHQRHRDQQSSEAEDHHTLVLIHALSFFATE
jgi:hypothetical protein